MAAPAKIRVAEACDAVALNALMIGLSKDSDNLLYEANEVPSVGRLERMISAEGSDNLCVAEVDDKVVGYAGIRRGHLSRVRHVGTIVLGVAKGQRRRGIGTSLVNYVIDLSEVLGLARLELRVSTDNLGACLLYTSPSPRD